MLFIILTEYNQEGFFFSIFGDSSRSWKCWWGLMYANLHPCYVSPFMTNAALNSDFIVALKASSGSSQSVVHKKQMLVYQKIWCNDLSPIICFIYIKKKLYWGQPVLNCWEPDSFIREKYTHCGWSSHPQSHQMLPLYGAEESSDLNWNLFTLK